MVGVASHGCGHVDPSLLLLLEADIGRFLVESNPEPLQLSLDDPLVLQRFEDVEDDENEAAGPRHCNHLPPPPLPVLCPFNYTWQIQQLNREQRRPQINRFIQLSLHMWQQYISYSVSIIGSELPTITGSLLELLLLVLSYYITSPLPLSVLTCRHTVCVR